MPTNGNLPWFRGYGFFGGDEVAAGMAWRISGIFVSAASGKRFAKLRPSAETAKVFRQKTVGDFFVCDGSGR